MSDIKTSAQIEKDFYRLVKSSAIASSIGGKVYRDGTRPRNSKSEDAVVTFVAGLDGQIQDGVVVVNVFVPKKPFGKNTDSVKDISRVDELSQIIRDWLDLRPGSPEYLLPKKDRPTIKDYEDPLTGETYIHTRIKFKRCAE
ncbi:MAG: hypothetical protein IJU11_06640 [Prevotella sp.]|nr:hypothetical protein [Prevotella sp.]